MSFKRLFTKDKSSVQHPSCSLPSSEKKAILGLKHIQAQQNPEPIFDLSETGASSLPDDTFTFCKILGKTSLIIRNNALSDIESGGSIKDLSTIEIIDAENNRIEKLPSNFGTHLRCLRILNLRENRLKSLPDSFNALINLEDLNLSNNRLSTVPLALCALPKLKILALNNNNIATIPPEFVNLQKTLQQLNIDSDKIESLPQNKLQTGLEGVMKFLCDVSGILYTGPQVDIVDCDESTSINVDSGSNEHRDSSLDDVMLKYMRKKDEQMKKNLIQDEKLKLMEEEQLMGFISQNTKLREDMLDNLASSSPNHIPDYEARKKKHLDQQILLEEGFRSAQEEHISIYLNNSQIKDSLLKDISANEKSLQCEVEAIVSLREKERKGILNDICNTEKETTCALEELLNGNVERRNSDFVSILKDQEQELNELLKDKEEYTDEVRKMDIMKSMQAAFMEETLLNSQRMKIEKNHESWINCLLKEDEIESDHLQSILKERLIDQEAQVDALLQNEKYQAEAFKLLLLKVDLERSAIIRQISLVEYELARLSSLEVRKKRCGIQYGSTTMLNQRQSLVGLLKSLLKSKDSRDSELNDWFTQLSHGQEKSNNSDDYWLIQYQRLMTMKPASLIAAEQDIDAKVYEVLTKCNAIELVPIFSSHKISFENLLEMSEEDFGILGIGSASYRSVQRSLQEYLSVSKLTTQRTTEHDMPCAPSAPEVEGDDDDDEASAPPLPKQFIEAECVVCLNESSCIVFLPCGHVCVCANCCNSIKTCPLCRAEISHRCVVHPEIF